jgi:hypothetical protein
MASPTLWQCVLWCVDPIYVSKVTFFTYKFNLFSICLSRFWGGPTKLHIQTFCSPTTLVLQWHFATYTFTRGEPIVNTNHMNVLSTPNCVVRHSCSRLSGVFCLGKTINPIKGVSEHTYLEMDLPGGSVLCPKPVRGCRWHWHCFTPTQPLQLHSLAEKEGRPGHPEIYHQTVLKEMPNRQKVLGMKFFVVQLSLGLICGSDVTMAK